MTGAGEPDGRLVVIPPYGERLVSPAGWPRLPAPKPDEPVAAFFDRAIVGDSFLQLVTSHTHQRPIRPLAVVHPAERTFSWWVEKWPHKESSIWNDLSEDHRPPPNYHRDRVYWRLVVEWFDRLRGGDPVMRGHRIDLSAYLSEEVDPGLLRNRYMELSPRTPGGGSFRPKEWRESEPPPGLPWYHELRRRRSERRRRASSRRTRWYHSRGRASTFAPLSLLLPCIN